MEIPKKFSIRELLFQRGLFTKATGEEHPLKVRVEPRHPKGGPSREGRVEGVVVEGQEVRAVVKVYQNGQPTGEEDVVGLDEKRFY